MKKVFSIGLAAVLVAAAVSAAMAWGPGGWGGGPGWCGMGPGMMRGYYGDNSTYSRADAQKYDKFRTDTAQLRDKMLKLRNELYSLRSADKPDWKAIAEKQKEIVDLSTQIEKKASEAGMEGSGYGPGYGPGPRGGYGPGSCCGFNR